MEGKEMRKGNLFTRAKKATAVVLATAMVLGAAPMQNVKAADNSPYVISQGRMVYASSSAGNSDPAYAFDGSKSTRWESAWANNEEWIYVDLGKVTNFTSIKLYWEGAYAKEYKIQTSNDEENWNTVYTNNNCNGGNEELNIQGNARYVRVYMTKKAMTAYGYSLYEFEVYGTDGVTKRPVDYGTNIAENKNVQASSLRDVWWMYDSNGVINQTSVLAKNAVDGNNDTYWCSGESDKQWFMVDLGRSYDIGRVIIEWNSDAGKMYDIQVSTNGNDWTTVYRQLKGYGYEVANVPMFATARYVRMNGYTRVESGSGFSIKEFKVYEYKAGDAKPTHSIPNFPESYVASNGKGTYLANSMYHEKTKLPVYKDDSIKSPIDSNDWWQSILINKFGNTLCTMPFKTKYSTKGLGILTATEGWLPDMGETDVNVSVLSETETDFYIMPENLDTASACDKVSGYSDYTVTAQLCDDNHVAMTSTFVKGSPYIFTEYGDTQTIFITSSNITSIFDGNGNEILTNSTAIKADHIGIEITDSDNKAKTKTAKSYYCLTVPENTIFKKTGSNIKITFPGKNGYMSVGTMLNKGQIENFYRHGYAFVTDTNVTYNYDDSKAIITSNYDVTTTVKRAGFSNQTFQCMLPHQWKNSTDDNKAFATYTSVRGDMKAIEGNSFKTVSEFAGLLPTFALPTNSNFDGEALLGYLNQLEDATKNLNPAGDAYWEGKNLHPLGMGVLMADQIGATDLRDTFLKRIKKILVNWFTYDGKDDISYFIYNQNWGTLYYEWSEFGANAAICDHHFTYGYFMFAATVLATYDEEFYNDYKGMIEMMIRDYANPSDNDSEYCRFRAYDLYEGHSWAGGYADNDSGNNQESASESLFSWVSMYLWGVLTNNDTYRDAGVFGFTNEMEAVEQYWFDYDKDNWVEAWPYDVVGQVYGGINFYGTFFGGQPLYVYGIQWLPISEYLTYYGMNQERCAEIYKSLETDTDDAMDKAVKVANKEGKSQEEIDKMLREYPHPDTGWQHITWPFLSQTNPDLALNKFLENDTKVQRTDTANTYWFIHAMKELGVKTTDIIATGDCSAAVYYNKSTDKYTATVWNPTNETKVVTFNNKSGRIGTATIGAKALVSFEVYKDRNFNIVQAETPEISVPSGEYDDTQYVTIKTKTEGATIHYTVDGAMPTKSSPIYDGTFAVSSTATVKAIAVKDECITSAMATSTITVNGTPVSLDTNIALGKEVTVSSAENPSVGGDKIVDNDTSTRWSSEFNDNEHCTIDLGRNYTINKVTFNWEASYAKAYKLQTSVDGNNWNTVYETSNCKGGEEEIIFDATTCRYVRMQGVKRALAYGYSLWEMGVYEAATVQNPQFSLASGTYNGTQNLTITSPTKGVEIRYTTDGSTPNENSKLYVPTVKISKDTTMKAIAYRKGMITSGVSTAEYKINGGSTEEPGDVVTGENLAKNKNVTASGEENDAMKASNAVDGNNGTRWSSDYSDDAWICVNLGKTYKIGKVVLNWEGAYGKAYKIQTSVDGNNWTTVKNVTDGNGGIDTITFAETDAKYVRMQGVTRALPYGYSLWEMEVYGAGSTGGNEEPEEPSGTNLAKGKKTTQSGSEGTAMSADNATDGNTGTRWSSDFADDAWMAIDLGKTYTVSKVVLNWEGAYGKAYKIQTSVDGNNWTTVKNVTDGKGGVETITFTATDARYVKMQGVTRALPYGYSIWEMEVYGKGSTGGNEEPDVSGVNVAKGGTADASGSEADGTSARYAFDGNNGTRWSSNFSDDAWISVDLGKAYTINKVVLNWEGAYGESYKIQTSTDGKTWKTVKSLTGQNGGIDTVTFDAVSARYVKMQGVKRALPYGYSLWEMEVYTK
jgi:endoglucanase Acf2